MKNWNRKVALLLATAVSAVSIAGCGNTANQSSGENLSTADTSAAANTDSSAEAEASSAPASAYPDYSNGFDKKVTIQIPVYDRAYEGWNVTDNYFTQWVQSDFGDKYNIDVEFVGISRSNQVTDYMMMIASGSAPDIIFHYDMPQMLAYYAEESMQPLDGEEIAYYAPDYWAKMSETIETYGAVDGETYFAFASRPEAYNNVYLIRQDWIDAVGKTMPQTLEEYNDLLLAWKEAGLGNGGGNLLTGSFIYDYPFRTWPIDEKERALYSDLSVAAFTWEPTYDFLKNLNYQYNNGLIDTEFYLNKDEAATQAPFIAGKSGVYSLYLTSGTTVIDSLLQNDPNAKLAILPASARVPAGQQAQSRAYWPFGLIMGINRTASAEERAAVWMYLNWLSQPENLRKMQYGVEGENYTVDADGLVVLDSDYAGESKLSNNNNKDYWCLVTESVSYDNPDLNYKANINNWAPKGYEYLIEDAYADYQKNLQYSTTDALFAVVIDSLNQYKTDLNTLWQEMYVQCVIAPEDQFEDTYKNACDEYLKAGYQEILDEKQAAIDEGKYN